MRDESYVGWVSEFDVNIREKEGDDVWGTNVQVLLELQDTDHPRVARVWIQSDRLGAINGDEDAILLESGENGNLM